MYFYTCRILICICFFLNSCSLEKEIEIDFPPFESKLVVESYLIPGKPYVVLLTETVSYGDTITSTPKIENAKVSIIYQGRNIWLFESTKGIYKSSESVPADYTNDFFLQVEDLKGRVITGKTKIAKPVEIDSIKFIFNTINKAAACVYFTDEDSIKNYYRATVIYVDDNRFTDVEFNGRSRPYISNYKMAENQKVTVLLMHVDISCYEYFTSGHNAYLSNVRPLIEPGNILSNIQGGIGVFTGISVSEKNVTVRK